MLIDQTAEIYVACPAYIKTGGTELLHQLVHCLNLQGRTAQIAYYKCGKDKKYCDSAFLHTYIENFTTLDQVPDNEKHLLIIPETDIKNNLKKFKNIQYIIWWLSVSYSDVVITKLFSILEIGLKQTVNSIKENRFILSTGIIRKATLNLYQSEYANFYLKKLGIKNQTYLSDYLNKDFIHKSDNIMIDKQDFVVYNPKKGYEFTKKIIAESPELNWKAIQGMTSQEVSALLQCSKVYIDFGHHPGKDRIPREAAISGCCIITGMRGSAGFYEDIPIDNEFKFKDTVDNIPRIIKKIKECICNYENRINKFRSYQNKIKNEEVKFYSDVKRIFGVANEN